MNALKEKILSAAEGELEKIEKLGKQWYDFYGM